MTHHTHHPNTKDHPIDRLVRAQKNGQGVGIASICSAHPYVIEATLRHAQDTGTPALIESTCNQVNQFGGYTGLTPADFMDYLKQAAARLDLPFDQVIVGGDHLGPNPWMDEPADDAMAKSRVLVRDCVLAGYTKIHLDASMHCADDPHDQPLEKRVSARRAAALAQAAEEAFEQAGEGQLAPRYVIGTEVPPPGGIQGEEEQLVVTLAADVEETIDLTRQAFHQLGLEAAWERVVAVVTQPGVEYGDQTIIDYDPAQAADLSRYIESTDLLIYEAHSTDYQTREALRALVRDHFAILKVGPALTFAFREAVFALAAIEGVLLAGKPEAALSRLADTLDQAMLDNPGYWAKYYSGSPEERHFARMYSLSDRSRYYWPVPAVQESLNSLFSNLGQGPLPLTLLSQYLPCQYEQVRTGSLPNEPRALIMDQITSVLSDYAYACAQE